MIGNRLPAAALLLVSASAFAWGDKGHEVTALIAYRHLSPKARAALDALLATDGDPLTRADIASRATWADRYRTRHRETGPWHYANIEIDTPSLDAACFHFPPAGDNVPASLGPARDCVVNKIEQFERELKDRRTAPAERLLALKFLMHFVGDLHQPLHAADHDDHGGNCVQLAAIGAGHTRNLHAFWDVSAVDALGGNAVTLAARLDVEIGPAELAGWGAGGARDWAWESFELGRNDAYALPVRPTCQTGGAVNLSAEYRAAAQHDAALQLKRAAVRLATLLNAALG